MNVSEEPVLDSREHSRQSRVGSSSTSSSSHSASGTRHDQSTSGTGQQSQGIASENTPINSDSTHRDYQATGSMRNRASGPSNGQDQGKNPPQEQNGTGFVGDGENHHRPWYIRMANRYGSLELENKGSVARDHLALGWSSYFLLDSVIVSVNLQTRKNIPCLVKNIAGVCVYRNCSNPALPFKPQQQRSGHKTTQ